MFEVGFTEILLIFGIALLVLGPERLPKLAADVGRWAGRARAMARQLRTQLEQEVQFDPLAEVSKPVPSSSTAPTIHQPVPVVPSALANDEAVRANDEAVRAVPAQLAAESTPPIEGSSHRPTENGFEAPLADPSYPDAMLQPEKTSDDRKPA